MSNPTIDQLYQDLISGDRSALSRSITLIESKSDKHIASAGELLNRCLNTSGNSIRIGITGSPGVGKSTFINAFGHYLIQQHNKRVAVLAIDPSSTLTGGSILGDKTRMADLASSEHAFVRPSPSGGDLGGVAAGTRESILLCEAAGFDVILIETVGVGQSEIAVYDMVDLFLLLIQPGSGDDLQGIKRGIMEMADVIVVNKSDGSLESNAKETAGFYAQAVGFIHPQRPNWKIDVQRVSSVTGEGLEKLWQTMVRFEDGQQQNGDWQANRSRQNQRWFQYHLEQELLRRIRTSEHVKNQASEMEKPVEMGEVHPLMAARKVADDFFNGG